MIWLAAVHDPFDGPEVAMVVGQIITAAGLVVVAVIANRGRKHSQVVREQVENDHQTSENPNLRVDLDEKERASEERDRALAGKVEQVDRKLDRVITKVGLLEAGWERNRGDIDGLMDTAERERKQRAQWGPPPPTRRSRRGDWDAR